MPNVPLICVKFILLPPTLYPDTAFINPSTSNLLPGEATPIPTFPPSTIVNTLVPSSWNSTIGFVPVWFTINAGPDPVFVILN